MKRLGKVLLTLVLCVCCAFGFVACDNLSATTTSTEGVGSNGGVALKYDGYLYFVNGLKKNEAGANVTGKVEQGGIYKAKLDSNGNVSVDSDGKPTNVSQVVSNIVGFDNGSIHIIGDFLYYATPNNGKNSKAVTLNYQTCFMRLDLKTGATQKLFTTSQNSDSETIDYAYYKMGNELYLLVYEKSITTLTSIKIGNAITKKVIADNAQSVLFSENYGEIGVASRESSAETFVYFTRSAETSGAVRTGVRVYKVLPNGSSERMISEGKSISLLTIKSDKLVYSFNSRIFAQKISSAEDTLSCASGDVISEGTYNNIVFVESGDNIGIIYYDSNTIRYIEFVGGVLADPNTAQNRQLYTFSSNVSISFLTTDADYVYYLYAGIIYKIRYTYDSSIIVTQEQLTSTSCESASGNMVPEIIDGYIYFFSATSGSTYLYRTSTATRGENGEVLEVAGATLFK